MKKIESPVKKNIRISVVLYVLFMIVSQTIHSQVMVINAECSVFNKGTLILKTDWENYGNYLDTNAIVIFKGNMQSIGGLSPTAFHNLTIDAGSQTTIISNGQSVSSILLVEGTLNAGGNLTLLSNDVQTALIDGSGTGNVNGNVIMLRYLPSAFGYHYISSPFQAATVGQLAGEIDLAASFPTFYQYDENRVSSGWVNYTAAANVLLPLNGYAANFGNVQHIDTFDLTGVVSNGSLQINLNNNNQPYTQGFNFVGNPYPSPIDWDAPSGWMKTNIDDALYFFQSSSTDQYSGTYSTYINGVSSDGVADNIISSMQGFFVHVSDGIYPVSGMLGMNNNVRVNDLSPDYYKSGKKISGSFLRLSASFSDEKCKPDPVVIYFSDLSTASFEPKMDALKLMNTDPEVPNLFAIAPENEKLSIDALPFTNEEPLIVPLGLKIEKPGEINFTADSIQLQTENVKVYFFDAVTGVNQNLGQDPVYTINLDAKEYINRFFLKLSNIEIENESGTEEGFSVYSVQGTLYVGVYYLAGIEGTIRISNMLGQVVRQLDVKQAGKYEFQILSGSGIYVVSLISGGNMYSVKTFVR